MRFVYLQYLYYGVIAAIIMFVFLFWSEWKYRRLTGAFARSRTLKLIAPFYSFRRPTLGAALLIGSLTLICIALGRPQWGFYLKGEGEKGRDIVFALDLSRSMTARDVSPNRLARAKDEIANFVGTARHDRVALIGFSGDAFLFCPLTMNYDTFLRILDNIQAGSVKRGGTSYYNLVMASARSFGGAAAINKILVILSDGEDTEGSLDKAIDEAKKERIIIYCVGVGTAAGGLMPAADNSTALTIDPERRRKIDKTAGETFFKDEKGVNVRVRLDEAALKRLAGETGGAYAHEAKDNYVLDSVLKALRPKERKFGEEEVFSRVYKERFQIPLLLAFIALAAELFLSMVNRGGKI